jgi:uncharacterized lipoprotein YddW (UPF0748 family)
VAAAPAGGAPGGLEWLWVVRTSLTRREDVATLVERARSMGVRGLLVQVVGRGDAWYRSDRLPRPEAIADPDFDPLGTLLPMAHAAGLEVHAWVNAMLVWSADRAPRDPRHVLRAHPEWVTRLADGRSLAQLKPRQRERMGLEGVFLAPGHPGVRGWLAGVVGELVRRYDVDGVHLDYIRLPGVPVGYDATTRARFAGETGIDPARRDRLGAAERAAFDSAWAAFQARELGAVVAAVRETLRSARPGLPLSAAVRSDTLTASRLHAQPWPAWLRAGLLDRAFAMCYAPDVQPVMDELVSYAEGIGMDGRVVPGFAVYNAPPQAAAAKINGARALGYRSLALYSYDALAQRPDYWPRLVERIAPASPDAAGPEGAER